MDLPQGGGHQGFRGTDKAAMYRARYPGHRFGMAGQINEDDIDKAELKQQEAILSSMTRKERANHLIIGPSRRGRIAHGSGTSVAEVGRLLKRFEKMRTMMKKMAKMGKSAQGMQNMQNMFGQMAGR
jgi:signal recognition particle subunit SRP54